MEKRDQYVEKYLPLAEKLARRYASRTPNDYDELFSAAQYGLLMAVRNCRRISDQYVTIRVLGEIKHAIRRATPIYRNDYLFANVYHSLLGNLADRAKQMRINEDDVFRRMASIPSFCQLSNNFDIAVDDPGKQQRDLEETLEVCLSYLQPEHHAVINAIYRDGLTIREASPKLGIKTTQTYVNLNAAMDALRRKKDELAELLLK